MGWWILMSVIMLVLASGGFILSVVFYRQLKSTQDSIRSGQSEKLAKIAELEVQAKADKIIDEARYAREKYEAAVEQTRNEITEQRAALERREDRLSAREDRLLVNENSLTSRETEIKDMRKLLKDRLADIEQDQKMVQKQLVRLAGLSVDQAKDELLDIVRNETKLDAAKLARQIEQEAKTNAEKIAQEVIVSAIQRISAEQTFQAVVSTVDLPNDEVKGRIIGREGRNIRSFEQVTGVNVMIDDTPETVLLSCYDPVRREVARLTLLDLVADGRIHPARIEEAHQRNIEKVAEYSRRAAEDALNKVGITNLDQGLYPYLGALRYRTSYGQNVLDHLVECALLAASMAAELGLNVETSKRAAFLHDIGKSVTHEIEGSHAKLGAELAKKYGEDPIVVHAIAAHHGEIPLETVEDVITQAADSISGSRPGARRESIEAYVKRLERIEQIAANHAGVDKVFAMQAGREVRVMVQPEKVSDAQSHQLARQIAKEIENELTYPGNIKVTVVRESRSVDIAY